MAGRPHKQGLDFFSWAVDFDDDEKISDLYEAHGDPGVMFFIRLIAFIYKRSNYIEWNKTNRRLFLKKTPYNLIDVDKYLPSLLEIGLLSKNIYEKYDVLTSSGIQERYLYMTKRRESVIYIKEFLLINLDSFKSVRHNVEVRSYDGETVKKYIAPAPGEKQKVKSTKPKSADKGTPKVPLPEQAYPISVLRNDISVPYEEQPEDFKKYYNFDEWSSFVKLNEIIDERFQQVRVSNYQLRISEYVELIETINPTADELQRCFIRMLGLGIKKDISIYHRFITCIEFIRNNKPPVPNITEPEPTIENREIFYRDEEFEEKVLRFFFGEKWSKYHNQLVILVEFCTTMYNKALLDDFREAFDGYSIFKGKTGFKHNFTTFLGSQDKKFADGIWDKENWRQKFEEINNQNKNGKQSHGQRSRQNVGTNPKEEGYGWR